MFAFARYGHIVEVQPAPI